MIGFIIAAGLGGWLSRMCGGGKPQLPFGLEQWLYALPYGTVFLFNIWGIPAYLAAVAGKRTGHGQYMLLGYGARQPVANDEKLDVIVRFFFGVDRGGNYWRCVFGLGVTGLAVTLLPGILFCLFVDPVAGIGIAFSGALKPLGYMLGWALQRRGLVRRPTVWGEVLAGVTGWGALALCF